MQAKTTVQREVIKIGSTNFKCTFTLDHTHEALNPEDSSITCNPKNKVATVNQVRLRGENGCNFVLSFKMRKGKGLSMAGTVECPVTTVTEPQTTDGVTTTTNTETVELTTESMTTVPEVEALKCGCSCDCPEDGRDCDCTCDCPKALVTAPPTCSPGFSKVCPMQQNTCPGKMKELCPPGALRQEGEEETEVEEVSDRVWIQGHIWEIISIISDADCCHKNCKNQWENI